MIEKYNPDVIIAVGEAGGRAAVSIERVAINVDDARIADNDNNYQPKNIKISANGENAYFSKLPIYKIKLQYKHKAFQLIYLIALGHMFVTM